MSVIIMLTFKVYCNAAENVMQIDIQSRGYSLTGALFSGAQKRLHADVQCADCWSVDKTKIASFRDAEKKC